MNSSFSDEIKRLRSIAEIGLLYCSNEYDRERYKELNEISYQMLYKDSGYNTGLLKEYFPISRDYPTAKVDIRGMLLGEGQKILLVKERADGRWSLPGGWADIGYSPKEVVTKEFKEETGLDIIPGRLLAVFDKKMHPHPPEAFYVYKMVFLCTATSFLIAPGFDVMDVQYFDVSLLPELSENRILKSQLELLYNKVINDNNETYVD